MLKTFIAFIIFLLSAIFIFAQECIPRNIILFLGDGMGFEHIRASEYYQGVYAQSIWNRFSVSGALSTGHEGLEYDTKRAWTEKEYLTARFTESAASATAISTGFRTQHGMLGITSNQILVVHLAEIAHLRGKSAGVITTVPFSHATAAGFAIHHHDRRQYQTIAEKMIVFSPLTLVMGAGHPYYDNNGHPVHEPQWQYIDENIWNTLLYERNYLSTDAGVIYFTDVTHDGIPDRWFFTDRLSLLENFVATTTTPERVFYLAPVHESFQYSRSGVSSIPFDLPMNRDVPSLWQLTLLALEHLSKNEKGFFLMVEGGAIDWAGHDNNLTRLIEEMIDFELAVQKTLQWIDQKNLWQSTLVIVMSDHETGYLCGGFSSDKGFMPVKDNGKGHMPDAVFLSDNHTNHLVPFFAEGCGAQSLMEYFNAFDSIRGQYTHLTFLPKTIHQWWGENVFIYPFKLEGKKRESITLFVSVPDTTCSFIWYAGKRPYKACKSFQCDFILRKSSKVYCKIICPAGEYKSQVIQVNIEN